MDSVIALGVAVGPAQRAGSLTSLHPSDQGWGEIGDP